MRRRHPRSLPRLWLMTDERMGEALWPALARLPRGAGVVFRHYATPPDERRALFKRVRVIARRRGLTLVVAGEPLGRADGRHGRYPRRANGWLTRSVHNRREAVAAMRAGADLIFVSPVFATRSHPDARTLGTVRMGLLLRRLSVPAVALGGMDAGRLQRLHGLKLHGWAAIDAWTDQKRNAVPT